LPLDYEEWDMCLMTTTTPLKVVARDDGWVLAGADTEDVRLVNDYLGYLRDRHYAPGTRRPTRSTCSHSAAGCSRTTVRWKQSTPRRCCVSWRPARAWRRRR